MNEKIISKLIELGQNMYYAYSYLKDDASKVKSAMEEWHKFVTLCMQEGRVLPGMEQIDIGVAWRDYVPVDAFEECERYGKWKIVPVELTHPVTESSDKVKSEDLEEELERFAKLYPQENACSYRNLITLARHFANWQKPAEWSDEDEKMCAATIFTLAGFMGNEDKLDWLKSLKNRVQLQPKQEWSEEQKNLLSGAILIIKDSGKSASSKSVYGQLIGKICQFLSDIRDNVSAKHIDWSEKDESMREALIQDFEMLKDGASSDTVKALYDKRIAWLKSLPNK